MNYYYQPVLIMNEIRTAQPKIRRGKIVWVLPRRIDVFYAMINGLSCISASSSWVFPTFDFQRLWPSESQNRNKCISSKKWRSREINATKYFSIKLSETTTNRSRKQYIKQNLEVNCNTISFSLWMYLQYIRQTSNHIVSDSMWNPRYEGASTNWKGFDKMCVHQSPGLGKFISSAMTTYQSR